MTSADRDIRIAPAGRRTPPVAEPTPRLEDAGAVLVAKLATNPLAGLMNGPLWTIPMELMCYLVLAAAGALGLLRSRSLAAAAAIGYLVFFLVMRNPDLTGKMRHWFEYPAYFAYGVLIALYRDAFLPQARSVVLTLLPAAIALFFFAKLEHSAGLLLLPPLLIYLGTRKAAAFSKLHRLGDPSYGIYVLGCPIQQVVHALYPQWSFLPSLFLALALAAAAGYASWHAVEAPALRLKRLLSPVRRLAPVG